MEKEKIKLEVSEMMSLKHMLAKMSNDPKIMVDHLKELTDDLSHEDLKKFTKKIIDIIGEMGTVFK